MQNLEQKPKCVLLGGVHGDDKLGVEVLTYYFKNNNPLFQLVLGNYKAVEKNKKFIDFDLLKAGQGDVSCTTSIEKCRAGEIHEVLSQFEYVIDIHGSHYNDKLVVLTEASKETLDLVGVLGVKKAVIVPKNNYLVESVPHNITLIKKVEAKPAPTKEEVSEVILMLNRAEMFFKGLVGDFAVDLYKLSENKENAIDFIKEHDVSDMLIPFN